MKRTHIYKFILLTVIAVSVQSCFVAKNYERPELEEAENLYRTDNLPQDSISAADISWRDLFSDPLLETYIEEGLQNNIDIRIALQQVMAAEAYMKQGKAGYLPSLNGSSTVTHQELSANSQFGSFFDGSLQQYELSANLSWEADIWGKIRSNRRATQATYLQTVAAHKAVKTLLVAEIASTYYQLVALDAQLEVTKESIVNRNNSLETIKALKEAGNVNQVAVDQSAAQLYSAQALQVDIEEAIFQTENAFSILLGRTAQGFERNSLDDQTVQHDLQVGFSSLLLRNRPDIMAAEYGLVNAFELTNVARSSFYPSVTLSATGGFQSLELENWIDTRSIFANLVGGLTQPIFNQRKIRTQYEVAKAQQEEALLNFKKSLLVAGQEVSDALYTLDAKTEKYDYRVKEVEALRKAEINSEELLNSGFANYLDLLTARQNALNAELNVIDTKLNQLQAVITLYRSLGGGWH
ncbi:efflux transporter, outer membrane factor (OMF) lipoprotein, NodT family [Zhouia amylolytica]|uniref:Efflux transporter, outer membrane factor (OMF) lipoprotein, NodT family n=1 Tax=Zhouia amylolytica TaxID=376730 RepID=A0A1I6SEK0_9FLAO|nr:efflux transporter outer membrane subunit [Zhouia amylolytica]MCQ0110880.1 efflux transporter outer membrane subunit [Zhouia amylolytica]SFS75344.1 efflux transporter, outer membrane factor (OMF) lipoprotein, NodT family [Zhouia amylolytica]